MNEIISKAGSIVLEDLKKIGKGALIALGGALIAFLGQVSGMIDYSHYGQFGPFVASAVTALSSILVNFITKWLKTTSYNK